MALRLAEYKRWPLNPGLGLDSDCEAQRKEKAKSPGTSKVECLLSTKLLSSIWLLLVWNSAGIYIGHIGLIETNH